MKHLRTVFLLTLLALLAALPAMAAMDFPTIAVDYDPVSREVIITGVPMYDSTGEIKYTLDGSLRRGQTVMASFCYAPDVVSYHIPGDRGYIFPCDDGPFGLVESDTYTLTVRLTAHPRNAPGKTLEKGPTVTLAFEYKNPNAPEPIEVSIDAGKGTWLSEDGTDCFNSSFPAQSGTTLRAMGKSISRITCLDQDFTGWIAYDEAGAALSGLLTTDQLLDHTLPGHNITFKAQWTPRAGYPVTAITYAAFLNGTGQPDMETRVTIEANGIRYSGWGSVTIQEEVYSAWTGTVRTIFDPGDGYLRANNKWNKGPFEAEGPVKSFIREGSCYNSTSRTGQGGEILSPRDLVNEYFYSVREAAPDLSRPMSDGIRPVSGAPEIGTLTAVQLLSGDSYQRAAAALTGPVVYDITAADAAGTALHQLSGTAGVLLQLPADFPVAPDKTAQVWYIPETGAPVACPTEYDRENHTVTFQTDHFSIYAVTEADPLPAPPAEPVAPVPKPTPVEPMPPNAGDAVIPTVPSGPPVPVDPTLPVEPTPVPAVPVTPEPGTPVQPGTVTPTPDPVAPVAPDAPVTPADPAQPETIDPLVILLPALLIAALCGVIGYKILSKRMK